MTYIKQNKIETLIVLCLFAVLVGISFFWNKTETQGSAPSGLPATVIVRDYIAVGPQQNMILFDPEKYCASRVITTYASPIMLNFSTSTSAATSTELLSGAKGHLQLASTTIAYDSGLYGCDYITAYAFSSTTITVSEFK